MADAYRQMLDLVKAALTGLDSTGANVTEQPPDSIDRAMLPALSVRAGDVVVSDVVESADSDAHLETHRLGVEVTSVCTSIAARDQSALEVKVALLNDARPGALRRYTRSDFAESGEGERPIYAVRQRFEIDYYVEATAPDVIVAR